MLEKFVKPNLKFARGFIVAELDKYPTDDGIRKKHLWMAEYFNAVTAEYPDAAIEPINLK